MSVTNVMCALPQTVAIKNEVVANTQETAEVANVSDILKRAKPNPTGYNGADGKVRIENGVVKTTGKIEGKDAGFFIAFPPIEVGKAKSLSVDIKGSIFQKDGWDHYASIQVMDEDGKRYTLQELCKEGKYGSCSGKNITKPSAIRQGTTLVLSLPEGLKTIARIEVVFVGNTSVDAGFTLSNIKLVK